MTAAADSELERSLFVQVVVYVLLLYIIAVPNTKLFAWGEGDSGGHVLQDTTSRGMCGLVCPSRTSDRRGERDKGERRRGKRSGAREGACIWGATRPQPSILRFDPQRRRFGRPRVRLCSSSSGRRPRVETGPSSICVVAIAFQRH